MVTYLSEPLVRGYTTGSACHVCVSQLKYLFGVKPGRFIGPLSLIYVSICHYVLHISHTDTDNDSLQDFGHRRITAALLSLLYNLPFSFLYLGSNTL